MLLIFMSEHMFRSRDQSVKIRREFFQIYKHGVVFLLPTLGPDTTSGDEDVAIHPIATRTLVFHRKIPCVESFRGKHVLLRRFAISQTSWRFHYQILLRSTSMPTAMRVPGGKNGLHD